MTDHPETLHGPHFERDLFTFPGRLARFCGGGGKAPQQTSSQKRLEQLQIKQMQAALKDSQKPLEMPAIAVPPPAPPLPPPPSQTSSDVLNAEQEARRQASRRRGIQSTLLAGPAGAPAPGALGGGQSLLG